MSATELSETANPTDPKDPAGPPEPASGSCWAFWCQNELSATANPTDPEDPAGPPEPASGSCWAVWWHHSFWLDWAVVVALGLSTGAVEFWAGTYMRPTPFPAISPDQISGTTQSFAISKPHKHNETVTNAFLFVICLAVPIISYGLFTIWTHFVAKTEKTLERLHAMILVLLSSFTVAILIVVCLKYAGGRLRPDFVWRVENNDDIDEGRLSWPSGHAALSAQGMTCLSLQIAGVLKVFAGARHGSFLKLIISLAPQGLSLFVAVSRTRDYWHNFDDVLCGYIIGVFSAVMVHLVFFYPLFSNKCALPRSRVDPPASDPRASDTPVEDEQL